MSVNKRAEAAFIIDAIVEEAKRLSREDGYFTEGVWAEAPNWQWDDFGWSVVQRTPCLYVWALGIRRSPHGHDLGRRRRMLVLGFIGVVAANNKLKDAVLNFEDDVHRFMIKNQNRTYPGSTFQNTYGVTSFEGRDDLPVTFQYASSETIGKGLFRAKYEIEVRAAMA